MSSDLRSKMEYLYQDGLAEISRLTERLEAVSVQVADCNKLSLDSSSNIGRIIRSAGIETSELLSRRMQSDSAVIIDQMAKIASEAAKAATIVSGSGRRLTLLISVLSGTSGAVAGLAACLLLKRFL